MTAVQFSVRLWAVEPFHAIYFRANPKGSLKNKFTFLSADASCLAALRKLEISRYSGAFAPCQAGASTRKNVNLFSREP
jgi:hypothetical protein